MKIMIKPERDGMSAKQWDKTVKLRQSDAFKRDIWVNMDRVIRQFVTERITKLEERRQEAMKQWIKLR